MRYALLGPLLLSTLVSLAFAQIVGTSDSGDQNLRDCVDGFATCNRSLLTESQVHEIDELHYEENLRGCLTGYCGENS